MLYSRGGVELPLDDVPLEGGVDEGVVLDGILLDGILLGGRVLGVALPVFGGHGPATVDVPLVPTVPVAPGVELPMVVDGVVPEVVPLGVELVLPVAVVEEVPFVVHGPVVVPLYRWEPSTGPALSSWMRSDWW